MGGGTVCVASADGAASGAVFASEVKLGVVRHDLTIRPPEERAAHFVTGDSSTRRRRYTQPRPRGHSLDETLAAYPASSARRGRAPPGTTKRSSC